MNISRDCAPTPATRGPRASTRASAATVARNVMIRSSFVSMRERPQPQLLLADLPQPGQTMRLHDQEEDDERPEHHELDLLLERDRQRESRQVGGVREKDGH